MKFGSTKKPMVNKYFISVDIEGITGVISKDFATGSGKFYSLAQKYMLNDVNAVVEGILDADENAFIVVRDAHGGKASNLDLEKLHPKAQIIQGWGGSMNMVSMLDETYAGVFLVGYHAGGQNLQAVLAHTCSANIRKITINDMMINESGIAGLYAGHYGVPVVFISGDDHAVYEAEQQFGDIVGVTVKHSLGRDSAVSVSLTHAKNLLRKGAKDAVEHLILENNKPTLFVLDKPMRVVMSFYDTAFFVSYFANLYSILGFDDAYVFDHEACTVSFSATSQLEVAKRIELIITLLYGFSGK